MVGEAKLKHSFNSKCKATSDSKELPSSKKAIKLPTSQSELQSITSY